MKMISRAVMLIGALAVLGSVTVPWVTVKGAPVTLHLGLLGANSSPTAKTVSGTDTKAWPAVAAVGVVVAALALFGLARKLLMLLGLLTALAGAGLLYYVMNVVDIETKSDTLKHTLATAALHSSAGAGPVLLLAGGLCILIGAIIT
ncbi:MAG TPA: Trp biosynthesis-associated membrane protein, partial [Acidimicrobiia bacterium]|nr:Trp biosynthesis-associated membrane protein [Acidimicrobiia bacterium]